MSKALGRLPDGSCPTVISKSINNEPMGFYTPHVIIGDARRHGVRVLPVHINRSQAECTVQKGAIRLGFAYVAGLGEVGAERVVTARPDGGYRDLSDLCHRTRLPHRLVENLVLAGGLVDWSTHEGELLWALGRLHYQEEELPLAFFPDAVALEPMGAAEELLYEYRATGVSTRGHWMELFRERLKRAHVLTSQDLTCAHDGQQVKVARLVAVRQAPATAKGFMFFTLEDEWGLINVIVRPEVFQAQREVWVSASVLVVEGDVQRASGQINVLAGRGWKLR